MSEKPTTDDELARMKAYAKVATPGPWHVSGNSITDAFGVEIAEWKRVGKTERETGNARLIAHARTDVPWLIAVIDALRAERNFLAGYISGTPGWTDKHPEEVLDWARAEAQKEAPDA